LVEKLRADLLLARNDIPDAARASPAHAEAPMPFSAGAGGGPYGNLAGYAWEAPPVNGPPAAPPPPYQQPVHYQPPPYNYH